MSVKIKNAEFAVHMLNGQGKIVAGMIQDIFDVCLNDLVLTCPPGRQLSIVRTKLEEACFFAKKSVASDPRYHEPEAP